LIGLGNGGYTKSVSTAIPAGSLSSLPSAQLGKYQLIRRLAMGGMAELFLARATALHGFEKLVVLKRILPQHAESEDFIRMFLAEARLAATLHHPNIVQVYDIGEEGGAYFFTMEYVQGQDLRKMVRAARKQSVPIPLQHVLHIVTGVAAGLNHAHDKNGRDGKHLGIVHRDVSPSNVLVTYEGGVKIVDFGIAKAAAANSHTIAGTLKGKIPYMSPEQCRGEAVDRRSDIFSIGTLLWEMTTGSRLFAGDNEFAILSRVGKGEVPLPSSIRPDYPPELEKIVMRAMQVNPADRYETALDLQIDLEDFAREARLPVSSARMGRFMRELFGEEMNRTAAQLASEVMDVQTVPQPVFTPQMLNAGDSNVQYTPSELRVGAVSQTPGPGTSVAGHSLPTGTAVSPSYTGVRPSGSPGSAVAVAILAGVLGLGGLGAVTYSMFGDEDPPAPTASTVEVVEALRPVPDEEDTLQAEAARPEDPVPTATPQAEVADTSVVTPDPSGTVDAPPPAEPEVPAKGTAEPDETPVKPKAPTPSGDAKTTKPAKKAKTPKKRPKATPKAEGPKYDPKSALPPGM